MDGRMREGAVFFEAFKESQSRRHRRCNYYEELMFPPPLTSPSVRRDDARSNGHVGWSTALPLPFGLPLCPRMSIHGDDDDDDGDELFHLVVGQYVLLPPGAISKLLRPPPQANLDFHRVGGDVNDRDFFAPGICAMSNDDRSSS